MTKQEYEGVAFTSGIKDGWQVSVTERSNSSADAVARLEATIALMEKEGYEPFVSYSNRASENAQAESDRDILFPTLPTEPVSVLAQAQQLGGIDMDDYPITPQESASIASGLDGFNHNHGLLEQKLKAPDLAVGDSFQIIVTSYKRPTRDKVEFYNEHSQFPAASQTLKGQGGEIFQELFPGWTPETGTEGEISPIKLYITGGGVTSKGNAYQNIKSVEPV